MNVYRTMWAELKNRVELSIAQQIPAQDIINLINAYENHFKQEIMQETMKEAEKQEKQDNKSKQK